MVNFFQGNFRVWPFFYQNIKVKIYKLCNVKLALSDFSCPMYFLEFKTTIYHTLVVGIFIYFFFKNLKWKKKVNIFGVKSVPLLRVVAHELDDNVSFGVRKELGLGHKCWPIDGWHRLKKKVSAKVEKRFSKLVFTIRTWIWKRSRFQNLTTKILNWVLWKLPGKLKVQIENLQSTSLGWIGTYFNICPLSKIHFNHPESIRRASNLIFSYEFENLINVLQMNYSLVLNQFHICSLLIGRVQQLNFENCRIYMF